MVSEKVKKKQQALRLALLGLKSVVMLPRK
jgi:hypothetical protein